MTSRALIPRELQMLAFMIDHAASFDPADPDQGVEDADRGRWRAQLVTTRAGRRCGCGSCPSLELTDVTGSRPGMTRSRVVLVAQTDAAMLLLFIDDDQLSYLELAPTGDRTFGEFPDPTDVRSEWPRHG